MQSNHNGYLCLRTDVLSAKQDSCHYALGPAPSHKSVFVAKSCLMTPFLLVPGAVNRYMQMSDVMTQRAKLDPDADADQRRRPLELWLLDDCMLTQLGDPAVADDAVKFVVMEVRRRFGISVVPSRSVVPSKSSVDTARLPPSSFCGFCWPC
jgi:hypothetical protein